MSNLRGEIMTKSTLPMVRIHNVETDEIIDREMTEAEFAQFQTNQTEQAIVETEATEKAAQKTELLTRLGITNDEAKLLLS